MLKYSVGKLHLDGMSCSMMEVEVGKSKDAQRKPVGRPTTRGASAPKAASNHPSGKTADKKGRPKAAPPTRKNVPANNSNDQVCIALTMLQII